MKEKSILIGTIVGVAIGTALGVAVGVSIGIAALGMLGVDINSDLTLWISTAMSLGAGISLVRYVLTKSELQK